MFNYTALGKSVKFLLLPTIVCLILACFITFSFTEPFKFIVSDSEGAYFSRFLILAFEIGLTVFMYFYYVEQERIKEEKESINKAVEDGEVIWKEQSKFDSVWTLFPSLDSYTTKYSKHKINDNLIILKKHA